MTKKATVPSVTLSNDQEGNSSFSDTSKWPRRQQFLQCHIQVTKKATVPSVTHPSDQEGNSSSATHLNDHSNSSFYDTSKWPRRQLFLQEHTQMVKEVAVSSFKNTTKWSKRHYFFQRHTQMIKKAADSSFKNTTKWSRRQQFLQEHTQMIKKVAVLPRRHPCNQKDRTSFQNAPKWSRRQQLPLARGKPKWPRRQQFLQDHTQLSRRQPFLQWQKLKDHEATIPPAARSHDQELFLQSHIQTLKTTPAHFVHPPLGLAPVVPRPAHWPPWPLWGCPLPDPPPWCSAPPESWRCPGRTLAPDPADNGPTPDHRYELRLCAYCIITKN